MKTTKLISWQVYLFCFLNKAPNTKMERRDLACENVRVHG
jgi:hypothetical protein